MTDRYDLAKRIDELRALQAAKLRIAELKLSLYDHIQAKRAVSAEIRAARTKPVEERAKLFPFLWRDRREHKFDMRHIHLAMAFLRGMPYWYQEQNTNPCNKPSIKSIYSYLNDPYINEEAVKAWIEAPIPAQEKADFDAHIAFSKAEAAGAKQKRNQEIRRKRAAA